MKSAERALIGKAISGFFPTPPDLADLVIERALIEPGMTVLEPSAGKGDLAVRAAEAGGDVTAIEINPGLVKLLELRGIEAQQADFLSIPAPISDSDRFDRIVMNPPFEDGQDAAHVRHALDFLKSDGVLVAIISRGTADGLTGPNQRSMFAREIQYLGGVIVPNADDTFAGSDAFRATSTRTSTVIVDRR